MRRIFSCICVLSVCSLASAQGVSLEECQVLARENYPQIKQLGLIDASEKYDLSIASATWMPQLSVSGKATWQSDVVEMPFEIPGFEFSVPHDQYSVAASLSQTVWDGGAAKSQKEAVKTGAEVRRKQVEVSLYSVKSRVRNIFLGIILLDEQIKQNELLAESLRRKGESVKALADNGMAYKSDLDIIKVNLLGCDQRIEGLKVDRASYVRMLGLLTGKDMSGFTFNAPSDEGVTDGASVFRPELDLYSAQLRQNDARLKQLNALLTPRFDITLQGGFGRPGYNMFSGTFDPMFIAGVRMQWNIGALYTRKNDLRKIDNTKRDIESQKEVFLFNTSLEAVREESEVDKARTLLAKDDEIIELRASIREAGEKQYRNGVIKMNDLMDMIDDEHDARLTRSVHHIQLLMAIYEMKDTLGQ